MIAHVPPTITVCATCSHTHLSAALRDAVPGETIVITDEQRGNFIVRLPLTIVGKPGGLLNGNETGTVLRILAPGVTVRDLTVRGSGSDFVAMSSAIRSEAAHTTLRNVTVDDALFGIYLAHADHSLVDGAVVNGRSALPVPLRGDALRIWNSAYVTISNSHVVNARDDLVWFSKHIILFNNTFVGGRYGIHSMYSDDMTVTANTVRDCEVGSYIMYTHGVRASRNVFAGNRGSTGYGIGLKSVDDAVVSDNAFVSNHVGVYIDNSPSLEESTVEFKGNEFAYNGIGFAALPSARDDIVVGNSFIDNERQVAALGGGTLANIRWSKGTVGNYWSDYAGYDRNGDGIGDVSYSDRSAFGTLSDLDERLDLLAYGPSARAVDFAARALPIFAAPPIAVDTMPQMAPVLPTNLPLAPHPTSPVGTAFAGFAALALSLTVLVPSRRKARHKERIVLTQVASQSARIVARGLRKRYGRVTALDGIDLDVRGGEAVALWGPNGSGKTTLLRCAAGIVKYEGTIDVCGQVGYVPQHLPAFDMRVGDLCAFVAALRRVPKSSAQASLREADLEDLADRNVGELSGGQHQRLGVALAAIGDPALFLLDEPTVGLDLRSRAAIVHRLNALKERGATIVIATHVPDDIVEVADRIVEMGEGRIVRILTRDEFRATLRQREEAV